MHHVCIKANVTPLCRRPKKLSIFIETENSILIKLLKVNLIWWYKKCKTVAVYSKCSATYVSWLGINQGRAHFDEVGSTRDRWKYLVLLDGVFCSRHDVYECWKASYVDSILPVSLPVLGEFGHTL